MKARAYLLQQSCSESEDSDSNASTKPAGPLNTKKFHCRVMEELKGNFFRVELLFTHKKMAEQKLQRMEILDAEHCAWLMVLAKTKPEFDHNLFLRRYLKWFKKFSKSEKSLDLVWLSGTTATQETQFTL